MVQLLCNSKSKADNNNGIRLINASFKYFSDKFKDISTGTNKILKIFNKILNLTNKTNKDKAQKHQQQVKCLADYQFLQLNQKHEIILKNLKIKSGNCCILCTDKKNYKKDL